jgi:hypothetical protein
MLIGRKEHARLKKMEQKITSVSCDGDDGVDAGRKFREAKVVHRSRRDERLKIFDRLKRDSRFGGMEEASILNNKSLTQN